MVNEGLGLMEGNSPRTIVRRNSVIEVVVASGNSFLRKTYHSKYCVSEEVAAFERLRPFIAEIKGIRLVEIYESESKANKLEMELIDGPDLKEAYRISGSLLFDRFCEDLVRLFVLTRNEGIQFDADPTNFIFDQDSKKLVLVDPVAQRVPIRDHAATVFLWGYLKTFLAMRKPWKLRQFIREWLRFRKLYLQESGVSAQELNVQIRKYIDQVIAWNVNESSAESRSSQFVRKVGFVPFYRFLKILFR